MQGKNYFIGKETNQKKSFNFGKKKFTSCHTVSWSYQDLQVLEIAFFQHRFFENDTHHSI
jgi:hypothetical protein